MNHLRARGFTLLEVLIALVIVTLSAAALLGAVTSSASNVDYLREKTLAEWVALNRLTEIRIDRDMPQLGRRKGSAVMGGQRWEWEEEVTELPVEGMFRVEVRAHTTGEAVDDTKPEDRPKTQTAAKTTSSGSEMDKVNWTSTAIGVIGSSRSDMRNPMPAPLSGNLQTNPQQPPPGGTPSPPKTGAPTT
jgi:general secretion pathway protein I